MDEVFEHIKSEKVDRFAIMGGTFDPIHYGHLKIAQGIRDKYSLDRIVFMPSGDPPHKHYYNVSKAIHRYNMVKRAISYSPYFQASSLEIEREGMTYTVDTMRELREYLGLRPIIYFITGADSVLEMSTWKKPKELLSYCSILSVPRPGYDRNMFAAVISELNQIYGGHVEMVELPPIDISSTEIRDRVAKNLPISHMVPQAVENYIYLNHLYAAQE